jgi:hypothetical protein
MEPGPRQNEYFIPRDGIAREVIQADICRWVSTLKHRKRHHDPSINSLNVGT